MELVEIGMFLEVELEWKSNGMAIGNWQWHIVKRHKEWTEIWMECEMGGVRIGNGNGF
jgi:hypothetical protein